MLRNNRKTPRYLSCKACHASVRWPGHIGWPTTRRTTWRCRSPRVKSAVSLCIRRPKTPKVVSTLTRRTTSITRSRPKKSRPCLGCIPAPLVSSRGRQCSIHVRQGRDPQNARGRRKFIPVNLAHKGDRSSEMNYNNRSSCVQGYLAV